MENYNKDDLAKMYQEIKAEDGVDIGDKKAKAEVDNFLTAIMMTLAKAKDAEPNKKGIKARLTLVNFGTFELKHVNARPYLNPQDKDAEPKIKPEHNKVTLDAGKAFKEIIN